MDITSEKLLEKRLSKKVKALGGWSIKLLSSHVTGLPNRLILLPGGKAFFVEVKTTGQKPRKIQLIVHGKLRDLGFRVDIIDTKEQIDQLCE